MAQQSIILKRSAAPGKVPDTGSLNLGEIAVNTYDGKLYFRKSGSVETIESIVTTNTLTTGSLALTGDLTVLGTVNARQFNIAIISSSTLFESGSSNFGNSLDDTHSFTGSVNITGSFLVNGNEVGVPAGPNTFDFNLDPDAAGTVNFVEDNTGNTQAVARTGSFDVLIGNNTYLSVSASAINVTTGSITANYMHLAKYISTAGDLDFNI
jgi:hypothetical protein